MGFRHVLFCSECGIEYKDREHHPHYDDPEYILERAKEDGWDIMGELHLCPTCRESE